MRPTVPMPAPVVPAKAGTQEVFAGDHLLDSRLCGNDGARNSRLRGNDGVRDSRLRGNDGGMA